MMKSAKTVVGPWQIIIHLGESTFVDTCHPALLRMWDEWQRGYRAMGYRVGSDVPAQR